jgi:hypothetical protein
MTVQIKPSQPKEQHNGLPAIEDAILSAPKGEQIIAIVTYEREKRVEDEKTDETYPVLGVKHIEPVTGDLRKKAIDLQLLAYQARTGENELDFSAVVDADDEDLD